MGGSCAGVGAHYNVTDYQSTHVQGGAIMGASPESSVVNSWCQHWKMPNLWVVGGSAFPQNGSVNPTLTIMAVMLPRGGRANRPLSQAAGSAGMKRRDFITLPAKAMGGVLLYTLAGEPVRVQAQQGTVRVPLRFFTAGEARVIVAACERIFPNDESGPGATEAGVVVYIDRQLAGPYGARQIPIYEGSVR